MKLHLHFSKLGYPIPTENKRTKHCTDRKKYNYVFRNCVCVLCGGDGVKIAVNEISDYAFKKSKGKCMRRPGRGKEVGTDILFYKIILLKQIVLMYINSRYVPKGMENTCEQIIQ